MLAKGQGAEASQRGTACHQAYLNVESHGKSYLEFPPTAKNPLQMLEHGGSLINWALTHLSGRGKKSTTGTEQGSQSLAGIALPSLVTTPQARTCVCTQLQLLHNLLTAPWSFPKQGTPFPV